MFKYFEHSDSECPKKPTPWKEIEGSSFDDVLDKLAEDWRVWDCDGGGDRDYYIGISNGAEPRYYRVHHEFYAVRGWDEELNESTFEVDNSFEIHDINKQEAHVPDDRDWLDISQFNYKLKKWPLKQESE